MDVMLRDSELAGQAGIQRYLNFYFLAGSETDPAEATKQYGQITGLPAEMPFWPSPIQRWVPK